MSVGVLLLYVVILCLLLISGLFPVISWVLALKSLIINTIHFSGMKAFSGWWLVWNTISGFLDLQNLGCMSVCLLLLCVVIWSLCLISGLFPVFSCVLTLKSLIINTIHFSGMKAFSGGFCLEHDFWIYRFTGFVLYECWRIIVICSRIVFIVNFRFVSGVFMCFGT